MNKSIFATALTTSFILTACATAPENLDRTVSFNWKLQPETTQTRSMTVEMGEIFFEWDATAYATHEMDRSGQTVMLTQASTSKGNLFCTEPGSNTTCYEDRNSDGSLDHVWTVKVDSASPVLISRARSPEELENPIKFRAASNTNKTMMQQKLGLLYDGAQFGNITGADSLSEFSGRFLMGWHKGKDVARTANGVGWSLVKTRRTGTDDDPMAPAKFADPNVEVAMSSGTTDGTAQIQVKAEEVPEAVKMQDLPDLDLLRALLLGSLR